MRAQTVKGRRLLDEQRQIHITKKTIQDLKSEGRRIFFWDDRDLNFGVEVTQANSVYYVLRWGRGLRRRIGRFPAMSTDSARSKVRTLVGQLEAGDDPFGMRRVAVEKIKLRDAVHHYLAYLRTKGRRERGVHNVEAMIVGHDGQPPRYRCFVPYLDTNLWRLRRDDILKLHASVQLEAQERYDGPSPMPAEYGHTVADEAMRKLRAIIEVQRKRIDDPARRPYNPVLVLSELKLWGKSERDEPNPFSDRELAAYISSLNCWPRHYNAVHLRACQIHLLTGFRRERAMKLRWDMDRGDHLLFKIGQSKAQRSFKFPVTPALRKVLDACREFGNETWVTPGVKFKKSDYQGPLNSDAWWRDGFALAGIEGSSHRVRRTVGTRLATLTKSGLSASWLLDHAVAGASDVTAHSYVNLWEESRKWLRMWHEFLMKRGLTIDGSESWRHRVAASSGRQSRRPSVRDPGGAGPVTKAA